MAVSVATFIALTVVCLTASITAQMGSAVNDVALPTRPLSRPCPQIAYDAIYDFRNPRNNRRNESVTVVERLTGTGCSTRGVLKLALAASGSDGRRVLVDLFFSNPSRHVFNLGDSRTNNGFGGDANTQTRDAEVHGIGRKMLGHLNDHGNSATAFTIPNLYR